jgi:hypothetical protein
MIIIIIKHFAGHAYSKRNNYNRLVPDFNFHSWNEVGINDYDEMVDEIHKIGLEKFDCNKSWMDWKY